MKKKILIALPILLILIQFIKIDKTPLSIDPQLHLEQVENVPDDISTILTTTCYDCHSAKAEYPWYTDYAPVSLFVQNHIKGGRKKLNLAEWGNKSNNEKVHIVEEIKEVLSEGRMPIKSYTWMHPEAKISNENSDKLIAYFSGLLK